MASAKSTAICFFFFFFFFLTMMGLFLSEKMKMKMKMGLCCGVSNSIPSVHVVGDSKRWTSLGHVDYTDWACTKNFPVDDALLFEYNNLNHNVLQVSHQDFMSCNTSSPIEVYPSGLDLIPLDRSGDFYYICGFNDHCQAGQKVEIKVTPISSIPNTISSSTPSVPSPPSTVIIGFFSTLKAML